MTGPEHYGEAESLLNRAADMEAGSVVEHYYLGAAQVHATLALAAATALGMAGPDVVAEDDYRPWEAVAGAPKRPEGDGDRG